MRQNSSKLGIKGLNRTLSIPRLGLCCPESALQSQPGDAFKSTFNAGCMSATALGICDAPDKAP